MRQFEIHNKEQKEITKIICNLCKKEIEVKNGIPKEDVLSVEKRWGYFSDKDNEVHFKIQLNFDFSKEEHLNIYSYLSLPTNVGRLVEDDFKKSLAQHHNAMYAVQLCSVKLVEIELL